MKKQIDFDLSHHGQEVMPHSTGLEKCVLGLILDLPDLFNVALKYLNQPGMFHMALNDKVWNELVKMQKNNISISVDNVVRQFEGYRDSEVVAFVKTLPFCTDTPAWFLKHCLKLNEYWIQRTLFMVGYYVNQNSLSAKIDPLELLGEASNKLGNIFLHIARMKDKTMQDAITELSQELYEISNAPNGIVGVKSSISGINKVIKGYRKGNLIIIGASTGEGKTTLALQEVGSLVEENVPCGIISLEMTKSELLLIRACDVTGVQISRILDGAASPDEMGKIAQYMEKVKKLPLYIVDKPGLKIGEIKAISRMWVKEHGVKLIVVDHMHLAYDDIEQTSEQRYTNIANKLKELAKELEIPIIALAQLSRKDNSEKTKAHRIEDLKYASGIEQAADLIMLIFRPELHGIDNFPDGGSTHQFARILIGKLRLLPKENISCRFVGTHFEDWDKNIFQIEQPINSFAGFENYRSPLPIEKDPIDKVPF